MIKRDLEQKIRSRLSTHQVLIIYGARQVGKTTLLKSIFNDDPDTLWLNGDDSITQAAMVTASASSLGSLIRGYRTVVIDEAQRIPDIGLKLKLLHDNFGSQVRFIATGSSSFDLANKINEPLTGRSTTFWLPQLTARELVQASNPLTEASHLPDRLIYGSYPAVVTAQDRPASEIISDLATASLYKDVLDLGEIIKADKLHKILQALAFQVGSQVSMTEIASLVDLDRKTVDKYISLLEQAFIIFRLPSFARNLRNELKTTQKIYFYDNGIRNAVINDFRPLDSRNDTGPLFENYIISELKKQHMTDNLYFWRNANQQEIDLVIEHDGLTIVEVKYNPRKSVKFPRAFLDAYSVNNQLIVNSDNYLDILLAQ